MTERKIQPCADHAEKHETYTELMERFKRARSIGAYFECVFLLYAVLEDRSSALCGAAGLTAESNPRTVCKGLADVKRAVRRIIEKEEENPRYGFDSLGGKLTNLKKLVLWAQGETPCQTPYEEALRPAVRAAAEKQDLLSVLESLDLNWRDIRNELTHGLFNKKIDAVEAVLPRLIEDGYRYKLRLDAAVGQLRRKKLRETYRIR